MPARKNVPVALHTELSEYASLLRTIRANSTLDLVPRLRSEGVSWTNRRYHHDSTSESERDEEEDQLPDVSTLEKNTQPRSSIKGKEKEVETPRPRKKRKRENDELWTRWPLLPEHCPQPEWTFDEEIAAIAERCIRAQYVTSASSQPPNDDPGLSRADDTSKSPSAEEGAEEDNLSPAFLRGLSLNAVSKLASLLSLLAAHRLDATWSKHNRIAPMSWRDILEIAGTSRLFDVSLIEDVQKRLEETFGPSDSQVVHRMKVLDESDRKLAAAIAQFGEDLFDIGPPKSYYAKRSKRKRVYKESNEDGNEGDKKDGNEDGKKDEDEKDDNEPDEDSNSENGPDYDDDENSDQESQSDDEDDINGSTSQSDNDMDDVSRQLGDSPDIDGGALG